MKHFVLLIFFATYSDSIIKKPKYQPIKRTLCKFQGKVLKCLKENREAGKHNKIKELLVLQQQEHFLFFFPYLYLLLQVVVYLITITVKVLSQQKNDQFFFEKIIFPERKKLLCNGCNNRPNSLKVFRIFSRERHKIPRNRLIMNAILKLCTNLTATLTATVLFTQTQALKQLA